jgi:hypothetical protein
MQANLQHVSLCVRNIQSNSDRNAPWHEAQQLESIYPGFASHSPPTAHPGQPLCPSSPSHRRSTKLTHVSCVNSYPWLQSHVYAPAPALCRFALQLPPTPHGASKLHHSGGGVGGGRTVPLS